MYHISMYIHHLASTVVYLHYPVYSDNGARSFLAVPSPPVSVQLSLKFINGDVNINATWTVSSNE